MAEDVLTAQVSLDISAIIFINTSTSSQAVLLSFASGFMMPQRTIGSQATFIIMPSAGPTGITLACRTAGVEAAY